MKKLSILIFSLLATTSMMFAQTPISLTGATAAQNFDNGALDNGSGNLLNTFPNGWGLAEQGGGSSDNGFYRAGTGSSNAGDARSFGMANSTERAFGGVASGSVQALLGFAFTNNTGSAITSMNISYTGEQWRVGDTVSLADSLLFSYSTNATSIDDTNATWVSVSALNFISPNPTGGGTTGAVDGNMMSNQSSINSTITLTIGNMTTVRFRWEDINLSGSDDGLSVDDFQMTVTTSGGPLPPTLLSTNPADNATNVAVATNSITMTFDQNVTAGAGNIYLRDIANSANDITVAASAATISGAMVTVSGITLNYGTDYAVQMDSTAFNVSGANFPGIYDLTTWNFTAENGAPSAVTSLNETFTNCMAPQLGAFTHYSAIGAGQEWRCSSFGRTDSHAVYMNGYAGGGAQDNEDWLISPPLDFSAMANPQLNFYSKTRFSGNNAKDVMVSTNYAGTGDPTLATWTNLNVNMASLDSNWQLFANTDLSAYNGTDFHIAFKYESSTTGTADEWSLDDIQIVNGSVGVQDFNINDFNAIVVGDVFNQLHLKTVSSFNDNFKLTIYDAMGKKLHTRSLTILEGTMQHNIDVNQYAPGMYFVHLSTESGFSRLKFIKR